MAAKWRNSLWVSLSLIFLLILSCASLASNGGAQFITFGPFLSASGILYPNITVTHYAAGTTTLQNCWSDETKSTAVAQPFVGDSSGIASMYCDGDYEFLIKDADGNVLYTWDNVKVTSDTATMWEGNHGTSTPSASAANAWQLFVLHDGGNNLSDVLVNNGTSFVSIWTAINSGNIGWKSGTAYTLTLDHSITADRTVTFPDVDGNVVIDANTAAQTLAGAYTLSGANTVSGVMTFTETPQYTKACPSITDTAFNVHTFTRQGPWCLINSGYSKANLRTVLSDDSSTVKVTVLSTARSAIIQVDAYVEQDTGADAAYAVGCVADGNAASIFSCGSGLSTIPNSVTAMAKANLANEDDIGSNTVIVPLDSSGEFDSWCNLAGTVTTEFCTFAVIGYME
jgi:hypothetical protein